MGDNKAPTTMGLTRRQFFCGAGCVLIDSLGGAYSEVASEKKPVSQPVDLFSLAFNKYGYRQYLAETFEKVRRGEVQNGLSIADGGGKKLQSFRQAWSLERRFKVNWRSLSLQPVDERSVASKITRVRFDMSCGFPVVALIGEGEVRSGVKNKGMVLLMHGTGSTPEQSLGLAGEDYMRNIGWRLMLQGYSVVCPFFPHAGNFNSIAKLSLLLAAHGLNFHSLVVSIALASLDVALQRKGAQIGRVYCYGVSIGALIGLHASLLDRRVNALILSGYVREDIRLLSEGIHDSMIDQGEIYPNWFTPGAWSYGLEEAIDIWRPRPLFIEVGNGDQMSGVAQGRDRVLHRIQAAYKAEKKGENFEYAIFKGAHEANGIEAINWLKLL